MGFTEDAISGEVREARASGARTLEIFGPLLEVVGLSRAQNVILFGPYLLGLGSK